MADSYCYPGSDDVLINSLGERDRTKLAWIEHEQAVMMAVTSMAAGEDEPMVMLVRINAVGHWLSHA